MTRVAGGIEAPAVFCANGLFVYQALGERLAPEFSTYALYIHPRSRREKAPTWRPRVDELARQYLRHVRDARPHGPYYLVGVSFGGVVAYEMAQQLLGQSENVSLLAMIDSFFPGAVRRRRVPRFVHHLAGAARNGPGYVTSRVKGLIKANRARAANSDFQMRHHALRHYQPRPYVGDVLYFRGERRPFDFDPAKPWHDLVRGEFDMVDVLGRHTGMLKDQHVNALAETLSSRFRLALPQKLATETRHENLEGS